MNAKSYLSMLLLSCLITAVHADVLELKNGTILNGKYNGGTAGTVRFETSSGVQVIETGQIIALTFTTPAAGVSQPAVSAAVTAVPVAAVAAAPAQPKTVTVAAGTMLLVRIMDSISSRNAAGTPFTTRLQYDLPGTGGGVAIKAGTTIYGRVQASSQAGRAMGRSTLDLRLNQIVVGGQAMPIMTSGHKEAGQASIAKAAKGAAAGAAIGGIAGDAGKGAAIGATTGALMKGQTITVTPGTLLEFTLTQPVTLPASI